MSQHHTFGCTPRPILLALPILALVGGCATGQNGLTGQPAQNVQLNSNKQPATGVPNKGSISTEGAGPNAQADRSKLASSKSTSSASTPGDKRDGTTKDGAPVKAAPPAPDGTVLSYANIFKLVDGKSDEVTRKRLVGRKVQLNLRATKSSFFTVNPKDATYFLCNQRSPSFKGGKVTATITGFEFTPEVDILLTLDRCQ